MLDYPKLPDIEENLQMKVRRTSFIYILVQESRRDDLARASQFHFIDQDEFVLLRSFMALQYLPASLLDLLNTSKPFTDALNRKRELPQFRKILPTSVPQLYWREMLMAPGIVVMTGNAIPDWLPELADQRPIALLTSSERTLRKLQNAENISAGLLKGFDDIREFYRVTGELLDRLRSIPALSQQVPEELFRLDTSRLLSLRPRLDFLDYIPSPQPWAGRSAAILYNRLSNAVEEPSLLPEDMDRPMVTPALLNWATAACAILAAREHGVGIPKHHVSVKHTEINRLAKLLASSAKPNEKFNHFMEIGRTLSGEGVRKPFVTIPVPRLDALKKPSSEMKPDLLKPFHRKIARNAVNDFMEGKKESSFDSSEAKSIYTSTQHTILQEQRLIACHATWLAAIEDRVPIQLRPFRGNVPNVFRKLLSALASNSKKSADLFRLLEVEMARSLPPGITDSIFQKANSVSLFSDYPYEWALCGDRPLCLFRPTARIPMSMSSWCNMAASISKPCDLTPRTPEKVLVLDLIEQSDRIRPHSDAFLASSSNIGNRFTRATPSTAEEAREIIQKTSPEIILIDSHGRYDQRIDSVSISLLGNWCLFDDILPDPPISPVWIVSACETAQSEAIRGCVVRSLLGRGAYAVIATLARVDAFIASMLVGRLFADIYQPLAYKEERNLADIFFFTQLTTALIYDPLLPLFHRAENDAGIRKRMGPFLGELALWAHGRPVDPETYHEQIAVDISELLLKHDLYDLHRNLDAAGRIRPETLLFSIFGFPERVLLAP
jgi:hypothetical protein